MSKIKFTETIDKFFSRLRTLEIEYEGQKLTFMVKPISPDEQKRYNELVASMKPEANIEAINLIYRNCLRDGEGNPIWNDDEEIELSSIQRQAITNKLLVKAFGTDLLDAELKN